MEPNEVWSPAERHKLGVFLQQQIEAVFTDNEGAIRLYESHGFAREGVKSRARKLEGRYQDVLLMALWLQ